MQVLAVVSARRFPTSWRISLKLLFLAQSTATAVFAPEHIRMNKFNKSTKLIHNYFTRTDTAQLVGFVIRVGIIVVAIIGCSCSSARALLRTPAPAPAAPAGIVRTGTYCGPRGSSFPPRQVADGRRSSLSRELAGGAAEELLAAALE